MCDSPPKAEGSYSFLGLKLAVIFSKQLFLILFSRMAHYKAPTRLAQTLSVPLTESPLQCSCSPTLRFTLYNQSLVYKLSFRLQQNLEWGVLIPEGQQKQAWGKRAECTSEAHLAGPLPMVLIHAEHLAKMEVEGTRQGWHLLPKEPTP